MNNTKGFTILTVIFIMLGFIVLGGAGYVAVNPELQQKMGISQMMKDDGVQTAPGDHPEVDHEANEGVYTEPTITWKFTPAAEQDGMPQSIVEVTFNGKAHTIGTFTGSCSQIGASGGIDGKGLLAGELSAAQCWFAGGGNEIGVFAIEDGGHEIMVGGLGEGEAGAPMFRGDFIVRSDIKL